MKTFTNYHRTNDSGSVGFTAEENETISTLYQNILAVRERASDTEVNAGNVWYQYAEDFCWNVKVELKELTGVDVPFKHIAYAVAALSNNVYWERQVKGTTRCLHLILTGDIDAACHMGFMPLGVRKAADIILNGNLDALTGPKVTVFAHNICGDYSLVCVDRHAAAIAVGRKMNDNETTGWVRSGPRRNMLEAAYHRAAAHYGEPVAILQAITWTVWR
jgi:hypothetical protein